MALLMKCTAAKIISTMSDAAAVMIRFLRTSLVICRHLASVKPLEVYLSFADELEHYIRDLRVELSALAALELADNEIEVELLAVDTVRCHGIEGVGDADDPAVEGDLLALEAVDISRAVVLLVMIEGAVHDILDEGEVLEDLSASGNVGLHDGVLLVGEAGGLIEYPVGDTDLAYIVEECGVAELFLLLLAEAELLGDHNRILGDSLRMLAGILVLGIDRSRYGEDGLVAHTDLSFGKLELMPLEGEGTLDAALGYEPCEPCHGEHSHDEHIHYEPAVIVDLLFLGDGIHALLEDVLLTLGFEVYFEVHQQVVISS